MHLVDRTKEGVSTAADWARMAAVLAEIEGEADRMALRIANRLCDELAWYRNVPVDELVPGVRTSLSSGLAALRERRPPNAAEIEDLAEVAELRAHQGLPLEAVLAAYRLGAREAWSRASASARASGTGSDLLLEAAELVWAWTDAVTEKVAAAHRGAEILLARHDQQRRVGFLQALLAGSLSPAEVIEQAAAYGMSIGSEHVALRARPSTEAALYQLEQRLVALAGPSLIVGVIEGDLVCVLAAGVEIETGDWRGLGTLGMGASKPITEMTASFDLASRVLAAAVAFGLKGAYRIEDLGLRLAVAGDNDVAEFIQRRYLEALEKERSGAQLIESIRALLAHGLSVDRAARALYVHPNTLRYRLRRVQQLIHVDFQDMDDLVGLWWGLQRKSASSAASQRGVEK